MGYETLSRALGMKITCPLYFTLQEKSKNFFPPLARIIFDAVCIVCLCLSCAASAFFFYDLPGMNLTFCRERKETEDRDRRPLQIVVKSIGVFKSRSE